MRLSALPHLRSEAEAIVQQIPSLQAQELAGMFGSASGGDERLDLERSEEEEEDAEGGESHGFEKRL